MSSVDEAAKAIELLHGKPCPVFAVPMEVRYATKKGEVLYWVWVVVPSAGQPFASRPSAGQLLAGQTLSSDDDDDDKNDDDDT